MILVKDMCTRYQNNIIDTVTALHRGDYTTATKHGTAEYIKLIRNHIY